LSDLQDHLQLLPTRKPDHPASQAGCLKRQQSQNNLQTKTRQIWELNFNFILPCELNLPKITWKPPNNLLILVDKLPLQQLGSVHQVSTMQNELCHCDLQPVAMNVGLKPNITETNIYYETFAVIVRLYKSSCALALPVGTPHVPLSRACLQVVLTLASDGDGRCEPGTRAFTELADMKDAWHITTAGDLGRAYIQEPFASHA